MENDFFPRDMRVYNECKTITDHYSCFAVAPRQNKEKYIEIIDGNIKCYRFPHFEANILELLPIEYLNAAFWLFALVTFVVLRHHIRIIHVANPPDFIIPLLAWLKIFGVVFIYDIHDLSIETFKGKKDNQQGFAVRIILALLAMFEKLSISFSDIIIATNLSIKGYVQGDHPLKKVFVVRNSNPVRFQTIAEIPKKNDPRMNIGYFGVLANDKAAGLDNLISLVKRLKEHTLEFTISVIGDGPGLKPLKRLVKDNNICEYFEFYGYLSIELAFQEIINFDFGLVTWGDIPKNNIHTAMKVMDYMCCGVPVCSLKLKEQMHSTQNIAIHTDSFEEMADSIVELYQKKNEYEELRKLTLNHFNTLLSWEHQSRELIRAYECLSADHKFKECS